MNTETPDRPETSGGACPKCGTPKKQGSPDGLCPTCLMSVGIGTQPEPASGTEGSKPEPLPPESLAAHFPALEVLEIIGQGGMGVVYRARQRKLDRTVALKVLAPGASKDPAFSERFHREARALARLNHPNIITVHDFGETNGLYYLVMEYVDGTDLRNVLLQGRLSPTEALRIVPVVCEALQYAHANGVVHRDIKPGNILLDRDGRIKIADFGIAKLAGTSGADPILTQSRQSMGTPHYMAPEQVENPQSVDHRADIYSLGVVFYEMLTGELPLGRFAPPSRHVEVDVRVDEVVLRALEKEPARRYQQAGDVKTEVERIRGVPSPEPPKAESKRPCPGLGRPEYWIGTGLVWSVIPVWAFGFVMRSPRVGDESPSLFAWFLGFLGALAPIGVTVCGAIALREALRHGGNRWMLRRALMVLNLPLVLAAVGLGFLLFMSILIEIARMAPGPLPIVASLVAAVALVGWGLFRADRALLGVLEREPAHRPRWLPWLAAFPLVLAPVATGVFLVTLMQTRATWGTIQSGTPLQISPGSAALPAVQQGDLPVHLPYPQIQFFEPGQALQDALKQASLPPLWTMTPVGPVFTDGLIQRLLGGDQATARAALDVALQQLWKDYREALATHLARSTNDIGHVVITVRPMIRELDRIVDRFWTVVDAALDPGRQALLRTELASRLRPRWTGGAREQGSPAAASSLLRFGESPYTLEFWREGTWYRFRRWAGAGGAAATDAPEALVPELPPEDRDLLDLTEVGTR